MTRQFTRRRALTHGLAGLTVVAVGGAVWRAWDRGVFSVGDGPAYVPWHRWRTESRDGPLAIVRAGILAANAHNTQPWRFQVGEDAMTLAADLDRHLGPFDPYRREMYLSLGCALENMVQAAAAQGLKPRVTSVPGRLDLAGSTAGTRPVATLYFDGGERPTSPLADAIPHRHTHRGAYLRDRPLSADQIAGMQALVDGREAGPRLQLFNEAPQRDRLGSLIVGATEDIIADPEMAEASSRWFRFDPEAIQKHRDGVTLDAVGLPPVTNAMAKMLPVPSEHAAHQQWLTATRDRHIATAPALGVIETRDLYDREQALAAGRLWQRLHLWATTQGLAAHPLNQPAEMVDRERALGKDPRTAATLAGITEDSAWRPTFVFRIGYAESEARLSPRRPVNTVVTG